MFAERAQWDLGRNALARRCQELRAERVEVLDLTESNPTRVGLRRPEDLLVPMADPGSVFYDPEPKGILSARGAVARIYACKGAQVDPERIVLTASTSEAYSHLFRLLADPGDQVLIPRPSYPLFGYLADLNDVEIASYPWAAGGSGPWKVDLEAIAGAITPRSRAIIVVHPNHPTGSALTAEDLRHVLALCRKNRLALIADEVFAEYLFEEGETLPLTLLGGAGVLTFALGGISKFLGLPQMKLAWIGCSGPAELLGPALERLEMIADTYLSVNTPAQRALPRWLEMAPVLQGEIRRRIQANRQFLQERLPLSPAPRRASAQPPDGYAPALLPSQGGWSGVLRMPGVRDDEEWALGLLEKQRVLVHPGYLFDFDESGMMVVSLLPAPELFQEGIGRLLAHAASIQRLS